MPDQFQYISHTRLEYQSGFRRADLGDVPEPVVYGVQGRLVGIGKTISLRGEGGDAASA
jgi:hypothetical protein